MNSLPNYVVRAPQILYVAALVMFCATVAVETYDLSVMRSYAVGADASDPTVLLARLRAVYNATREAIYIASSGLLMHVMLAIWSRLGAKEAAE
jgi:hypothetical protein